MGQQGMALGAGMAWVRRQVAAGSAGWGLGGAVGGAGWAQGGAAGDVGVTHRAWACMAAWAAWAWAPVDMLEERGAWGAALGTGLASLGQTLTRAAAGVAAGLYSLWLVCAVRAGMLAGRANDPIVLSTFNGLIQKVSNGVHRFPNLVCECLHY